VNDVGTDDGVAAGLARTREAIAEAAQRAGRPPGDVTLVAVSKGFPVSSIRAAQACGQRDFGENRVQEAAAKYKELGTEVRWHFIGRMQRNKVRELVGWVGCIHSVDRAELAIEIDRRAQRAVEVLIEVNVSGEAAKGGVSPAGLMGLVESMAGLGRISVAGLMGMAPRVGSPEEARPYFRQLAGLRDAAAREFPELPLRHLSMGMSQDYRVAIEEGATIVRVGEAIFGRRSSRVPEEEPVATDIESAGKVKHEVKNKVKEKVRGR
jgi:pyridoxal phosphate enzyme (YggS family)